LVNLLNGYAKQSTKKENAKKNITENKQTTKNEENTGVIRKVKQRNTQHSIHFDFLLILFCTIVSISGKKLCVIYSYHFFGQWDVKRTINCGKISF